MTTPEERQNAPVNTDTPPDIFGGVPGNVTQSNAFSTPNDSNKAELQMRATAAYNTIQQLKAKYPDLALSADEERALSDATQGVIPDGFDATIRNIESKINQNGEAAETYKKGMDFLMQEVAPAMAGGPLFGNWGGKSADETQPPPVQNEEQVRFNQEQAAGAYIPIVPFMGKNNNVLAWIPDMTSKDAGALLDAGFNKPYPLASELPPPAITAAVVQATGKTR